MTQLELEMVGQLIDELQGIRKALEKLVKVTDEIAGYVGDY